MTITVFAANGRSGRSFVLKALAAGHTVIAAVHGYNLFDEQTRLRVLTCDVTNEHQVAMALVGAEAVVSFIGHIKNSPRDVQTVGITTILKAMQSTRIRRLVSLTGTGVRFSDDRISLLDRLLNLLILIVDPSRVRDGKQHVAVIRKSNVDWTILRVLKLTNSKTIAGRLSSHGPARLFVSRQTVGALTLEVLEQKTFIQAAPIIS